MKSAFYFIGLTLVLMLNNCTPKAVFEITPTLSRTPIPTPKIETIRVVIGETPPKNTNAIIGTWRLDNFTISSKGNLAGKLTIRLNYPERYISSYPDVLMIRVWANYVWPQFGDLAIQPAGKFIPVKASLSNDTSATFDIKGIFDFPQLMLDKDGGMPLDHIQVTMVWYRLRALSENGGSYYGAKIGTPENLSDEPWRGTPIIDQTVSLSGTIDTNIRGGLAFDYWEWFLTNLPTSTPISTRLPYPAPVESFPPSPYPAPVGTDTPFPSPSYP